MTEDQVRSARTLREKLDRNVDICTLEKHAINQLANSVLDADFDQTWDRAARKGICDTRGGAEYTRVKAEWLEAGRPDSVGAFIARHANVGAH